MAGADEENYLDNLLSSVGDEAESNENSESPTSNNNADTYNDDNNTSKETQKEENMNLDLSEPDLSESDLERLESMKLDSIIEQVTSDDVSVEELLNDDVSNTSKESKENSAVVDKEDNKTTHTANNENENVAAINNEAINKNSNQDVNNTSDIQLDIIEDIDSKGKKRSKKEKKKGLIAALKNIFFEDVDEEVKASVEGANTDTNSSDGKKNKKDKKSKKESKKTQQEDKAGNDSVEADKESDKPMDENQQLLDEMYGDKDNLDENIAPKKGLFAKIRYRLQQYKQKSEEEERLEEEAEIADQDKKKKLKEQKTKEKADKKEEAKKAKEEKAKEKAEKEKKPKKEKPKKEKKVKPAPKPGDILKIKPKSMVFFVLFIAGVVVLIILFNSAFHYNKNVSEAKGYIESGNYAKAYQRLSGLSLRKNDESLLRQVSVIMFVQRQTESYNNYMQLDMKDQALNSLVKGLERYKEYYREAEELGIASHLDSEKETILGYFKSTYNMSEEDANKLVQLKETDFVSYYASLVKYRKAKE